MSLLCGVHGLYVWWSSMRQCLQAVDHMVDLLTPDDGNRRHEWRCHVGVFKRVLL